MAYETPAAILTRHLAIENQKLFQQVFCGIHKTPTLAQYNPFFITFESLDSEILLTGDNAIPLIRYAVGDRGGVITFEKLTQMLQDSGLKLYQEARRAGIDTDKHIYKLPLVYVYERSDFAVKLHLRDIYPETIRDALMHRRLSRFLSGKLTMTTKYDSNSTQYLEVNLELRKGKRTPNNLRNLTHKRLMSSIFLKTAGPGDPGELMKRSNLVKIIFWPSEHPLHFKPGIKQKWVKQ